MRAQLSQAPASGGKTAGISQGVTVTASHGTSGECVVSRAHGRGYTKNYRGRTYSIQTQSGQFITEIIGTTQTIGIWNPLGSGVVVSPLRFYAFQTSAAAESYSLSTAYTPNTGNKAATGSAITSITPPNTTTVPSLIQAGYPSPAVNASSRALAFAGNAIITLNANPIRLKESGSYIRSDAAPAAVNRFPRDPCDEYSFGEFLISPGTAVWWGAHGAVSSIFWMELCWSEIPL